MGKLKQELMARVMGDQGDPLLSDEDFKGLLGDADGLETTEWLEDAPASAYEAEMAEVARQEWELTKYPLHLLEKELRRRQEETK